MIPAFYIASDRKHLKKNEHNAKRNVCRNQNCFPASACGLQIFRSVRTAVVGDIEDMVRGVTQMIHGSCIGGSLLFRRWSA